MKTFLFVDRFGVSSSRGKTLRSVLNRKFNKDETVFAWCKADFDKNEDIVDQFMQCDWWGYSDGRIIDITKPTKPIEIKPELEEEEIDGWK